MDPRQHADFECSLQKSYKTPGSSREQDTQPYVIQLRTEQVKQSQEGDVLQSAVCSW